MLSIVTILWLALATAQPGADAIPPAAWTDLRGHEQTLEDYRGRIVVLNFWATWCTPCREEMPDLVRIQQRYGMFGVQVIGASADELSERAAVEEFARRHKINFPILMGATTAQMKRLGAGVGLPATLVFDRDGQVVQRFSGVFDPEDLEARLDRLLEPVEDAGELDSENHEADAHDHGPTDTEASLVPS